MKVYLCMVVASSSSVVYGNKFLKTCQQLMIALRVPYKPCIAYTGTCNVKS